MMNGIGHSKGLKVHDERHVAERRIKGMVKRRKRMIEDKQSLEWNQKDQNGRQRWKAKSNE